MSDERIIPLLDPEPMDEEYDFVADVDQHTLSGWNGHSLGLYVQDIAALRVKVARATIEWAAEKANIADMSKPGSAGEYIYNLLAAHDAAMAKKKEPKP